MNKLIYCLLIAVSAFARSSFADNELLATFKDSSVRCDYLIVTIQDFVKPAVALAQYRNSYTFDKVEHAKVVLLSQIITEFPGYEYNQRNIALWRALKWARENWKIPFAYLVLMGNDEVRVVDSTIVSTGAIPAWYLEDKVSEYQPKIYPEHVTDDFYIHLSTLNPPESYPIYWDSTLRAPTLSIGRIPAANAAQCSIYVEKVKFFDLSRRRGVWRNSILAIADDAMQLTYIDAMSSDHQIAAEQVVRNSLQGYSVTKAYLSAYPLDQFYEKPAAMNACIQAMDRGVSWAFYFGHGNDHSLADENVLTSETIDGIANDSMPFVFVSMTATNGFFLASAPRSMCLKYLFSPRGGAIAYIASVTETYSENNKQLADAFFSEVKNSPSGNLGTFLARAKYTVYYQNQFSYDQNQFSYFLLGDPAIRVSTGVLSVAVKSVADSNPSHIRLSLPGVSTEVHYSVTFTIRDSVLAAPVSQSIADLSFSCDSTIGTFSGVFRDSATIEVPKGLSVPIKAIVYVWNDTADGRAELMCNNGSANPVLLKTARLAAPVRPTLRKIRGGLSVAGLEAGVNRIRIFDMLGRNIYSGEIPAAAAAAAASIDLANRKLRDGRYVLEVAGRTSRALLPFVYMAGD